MKFEDKPVQSSNIRNLTYDSETENLIVEFPGGDRYQYEKVPEKVVENFLKSESKGRFLHHEIKNKYLFKKITHRREKDIEDAIQRVYAFLNQIGYKGERVVSEVKKDGKNMNVMMEKPEGLFIVKEDKTVEDNYQIFE